MTTQKVTALVAAHRYRSIADTLEEYATIQSRLAFVRAQLSDEGSVHDVIEVTYRPAEGEGQELYADPLAFGVDILKAVEAALVVDLERAEMELKRFGVSDQIDNPFAGAFALKAVEA